MNNKFLIIDSRPYGLFSIFLHTIDNIKWAEDNGYVPVVRWGAGRVDVNKERPGATEATRAGDPKHVGDSPNFVNSSINTEYKKSLYSSDAVTNPWNHFFEPLNEYTVEDALAAEHEVSDIFQVGFHDLNIGSLDKKFLIYNLHSYTPLTTWLYFIDNVGFSFEDHRKAVGYYVDKYVKIKPQIQNKIDGFANKHFTDNMIGVHIRGTDKKTESTIGQRPFVTIRDYLNCIEKVLIERPDAGLFIA